MVFKVYNKVFCIKISVSGRITGFFISGRIPDIWLGRIPDIRLLNTVKSPNFVTIFVEIEFLLQIKYVNP